MIHPAHLRRLVSEVLERMGAVYSSPAAVELLMLTAAHESRLGTYLWQHRDGGPRGPALGIYQMEPATHADLWRSYLRYRRERAIVVAAEMGDDAASVWEPQHRLVDGEWLDEIAIPRGEQQLPGNLFYATAAARMHYYWQPEPLPAADDVEGLAGYWHRHWCRGCAGTVDQAIAHYRELALRDAG